MNQSKNKIDSFKVNDTEMISVKFQIYSFNSQGRKKVSVQLRSLYGNFIKENVWAHT